MTNIISQDLVLAIPADGVNWLFEIGLHKLSTKTVAVTYGGDTYEAGVIPSSFNGVTMRWDISGNGLIAPNDFDFAVIADGYAVSDFEDEFCTIKLVIDKVEIRSWKFKINRCLLYYGQIKCYCVDFLHTHLNGEYPNTPHPKEVWSSGDDDAENKDNYCIPVVLGVAYIPVRSVNTGLARWYVLGESGPTYTVNEVKSPHNWPSQVTWDGSTYTMTGAGSEGYQLLQPIIADSTGDGNADAPGLWRSGDTFYDMLCRYSRDDTVSITNPADCIEYVLKDFGVVAGNIDTTTFTAAKNTYNTQTVGFDGSGWWQREARESVLSNLLVQVDSYLVCSDKVGLYQFSKTPQETIDNVLSLSFSPNKITKSEHDSGRVHWPEAYDKPHDVLNGKAIVPTSDAGAKDNPSSTVLKCHNFSGQSINAQKAGILYFQKSLEQSQKISFSTTLGSLTNQDTLHPGQVITVNNVLYGGTINVIIASMSILPDTKIKFQCVSLNTLEDWGDLTTTTKDVVTDTSEGWRLYDTDYGGNLGADWTSDLLNIPDRFKETASLGINVTDSYLGYYDGAVFQSYIGSDGKFQFRGDANNFVNWNGTSLTIKGVITVTAGSNVAVGADVTADNAQDYSWITGTKPPTDADKTSTIIAGGLVTTGRLEVQNSSNVTGAGITGGGSATTEIRFWAGNTYANRASAPFRVTHAGDITANQIAAAKVTSGGTLEIDGNIKVTSSGNIYFYDGATYRGGIYTLSGEAGVDGILIFTPSASLHLRAGATTSADYGYVVLDYREFAIGARSTSITSDGSLISISGTAKCRDIYPNLDLTYDLGTSSRYWDGLYNNNHYFSNGLSLKYRGTTSIGIYDGSTIKFAFWNTGNFAAAGSIYEDYSFSLDLKNDDKWNMFNSLLTAFQTHNKWALDDRLRYKIDEEDEFGPTGEYKYYTKPRDFTQVLAECVGDIKQRLEALENAR